MTHPRSVLVLLHEHDGYPRRQVHLIWDLAVRWRAAGIHVRVARGPSDPVAAYDADLVIPHVNLSVTPPEYRSFLESRPNVVNVGVYDISKRAISTNLVSPDDDYDGPVIVKTDKNYGGLPELTSARRAGTRSLLGRVRRRLFGDRPALPSGVPLAKARVLRVGDYEVFERKADVPPGVFANRNLVVERFLPEREGDLYSVRLYTFFGDHDHTRILGSLEPIVKGRAVTTRGFVEPHPDIVALRHELGWDFGKWDYVMRDGRAIVLDMNRTPGRPDSEEVARENARSLAGGIDSLLARGALTR